MIFRKWYYYNKDLNLQAKSVFEIKKLPKIKSFQKTFSNSCQDVIKISRLYYLTVIVKSWGQASILLRFPPSLCFELKTKT
jgi:hypothetical protein